MDFNGDGREDIAVTFATYVNFVYTYYIAVLDSTGPASATFAGDTVGGGVGRWGAPLPFSRSAGGWAGNGRGTPDASCDGAAANAKWRSETKAAELTATQDSLAAALVTQIALRLERLDPAQCLRHLDDGDANSWSVTRSRLRR